MNANAIQEKILSDARTSASDIMRDANEKAARLSGINVDKVKIFNYCRIKLPFS